MRILSKVGHLYIFGFFLLLLSCSGDDESTSFLLAHDGDNVDAPSLPSGSYQAAARFSTLTMRSHIGKSLREIRFYIKEVPQNCKVIVYSDLNGQGQLTNLYEAPITDLRDESWYVHSLPIDLEIESNQDLWIAIGFDHTLPQRVLGCDAGPASPDGDWLYQQSDQAWTPLVERYPQVSINWNIKGLVE